MLREVRKTQLTAAIFVGRELDPRKLDDAAFKEVANLPGAGIVAMPEQSDHPVLGGASSNLVCHAISPGPIGTIRVQAAHRRPSATP